MTPSSGIWRLYLIGGIFLVLSLLIIGQMIRIQNSEHARELTDYFANTYNQQVRVISPERGNIYDRWGNLLAGNIEVYEVGISPPQVINSETIARDLSSVLEVDYEDILKAAQSYVREGNEQYFVVKDFVPSEKIQQLEEKIIEYKEMPRPNRGQSPSLVGVHWVPHLIRSYPENSLAANILGFYNFFDRQAGRGFFGLEEQYNYLLAGAKQRIVIPMNPTAIQEFPEVPPGSSLILTIDREIQAAMEAIVDQTIEESGSESVTIVVMDPETGEILAMATNPHFNPNEYNTYKETFPPGSHFNRAVSQLYEPGSVFKVFTMAAAIDAGVVQADTPFLDTGAIEVGGIWIYNWDRGAWGPQDMVGCMQHSLNVCLAWVAKELGPTQFYQYLQNFGIGRFSGIDLAGEQVYPVSQPGDPTWYPINLGTNSFGQGVAATPIQMISGVAALANDGRMMTPHVVRAYIQDGHQYNVQPRVLRQVLKPETAEIMTEMLAYALEEEASSALVEGYRFAGKTGTGQIPGPGGYTSSLTNASFVGWGPVDDPKFIIYVWLEKPQTSQWGSVVAAPVFQKAASELVVLMKLPPDEIRRQFANP